MRHRALRHSTASAVVIGSGQRVLLVQHVKSGLWLYPGGHIEPGELPADAARREVREETGLDVEIITGPLFTHAAVTSHVPPFAIIEMPVTDPQNGPHRHVDFVYVCQAAEGSRLRVQAGEVTTARWAAVTDFPAMATPAELPALTARALGWVADLLTGQ